MALIDGDDPCAIPREVWMDNVDFWPAITYMHIGLCLLFTPREDLQKYKILDSYARLFAGWIREVLVRRYPGDKALVVAKVSLVYLI